VTTSPDGTSSSRYALDNAQAGAGERLDALSQLFNPTTFRHLRATGVGPQWRTWEVGAGTLSVARWLAEQTQTTVLATDIDTSRMTDAPSLIDVRRHDIGRDDMEPNQFDLIHARLVLVHVADRERALRTMISALRPGGWLVLEEADPALQPLVCLEETGPREVLANRLKRGFREILAANGTNLAFGRTLPSQMRRAGLINVSADGYFPVGGPLCAELELRTLDQIGDRLIAASLATADELDQHRVAIASGELDFATSPLISAWGQRPSTTTDAGS
jgi:SAM-dependent methyltransferase